MFGLDRSQLPKTLPLLVAKLRTIPAWPRSRGWGISEVVYSLDCSFSNFRHCLGILKYRFLVGFIEDAELHLGNSQRFFFY